MELELSLYRSPRTSPGKVPLDASAASVVEDVAEERVFHGQCTVPDLARAVLAQLERTLLRHGFVRYRKLHVYEQFPVSLLFRLRNYLLEREGGEIPEALRNRNESSLREEVDYLRELLDLRPDRAKDAALPAPFPSAAASAPEALQMRFQLREAGWADAWISVGGPEFHFWPGYLTHALGELSHAAVRLLDPAEPRLPLEGDVPEIRWEGEPQRLRWELHRLEPGLVDVHVFYTRNAYDWDPDLGRLAVSEELVLRTQVSPAGFGAVVLAQLEQVLRKHGLLGYRECWIDSEFPLSDYLKLHGLLSDAQDASGSGATCWDFRGELGMLYELIRRSDPGC